MYLPLDKSHFITVKLKVPDTDVRAGGALV